MWIRITQEYLRYCPECQNMCLKMPETFYLDDYLDDAEDPGICYECIENFVAGLPDEIFRDFLEDSNPYKKLAADGKELFN